MISVCIATHNGEKYIKEQLDSILCQLSTEDEVVISDDGSTDSTLEILSDYNDSRIKGYQYKQPYKSRHPHSYVCKNFENALKHAEGDYIFLSDQDDYWMEGKVDKCVELLKTNLLVVHNADLVDQNLMGFGRLMYKNDFVFRNFMALKRGKYYGCTLAFRRELLNVILPFPKSIVLHDHWIGCLAELTGEVVFHKESLMKYRQHNTNTSDIKNNSLLFRIGYRVELFINIFIRFFKCYDSKKNKTYVR